MSLHPMLENSMVVGATAEYERQFPDMTPDHLAVLREAAEDDVSETKWWSDFGLPENIAEYLAYLCMAALNTQYKQLPDDAKNIRDRVIRMKDAAVEWQMENGDD